MPSVLWRCWLGIRPVKNEWWGACMVICLERRADLHMAQMMPPTLTVSCFSKIQIGFTFLVPAHPGSPRKGPLNGCACVCFCILYYSLCSMCYNFIMWHCLSVLNNIANKKNTTKTIFVFILSMSVTFKWAHATGVNSAHATNPA